MLFRPLQMFSVRPAWLLVALTVRQSGWSWVGKMTACQELMPVRSEGVADVGLLISEPLTHSLLTGASSFSKHAAVLISTITVGFTGIGKDAPGRSSPFRGFSCCQSPYAGKNPASLWSSSKLHCINSFLCWLLLDGCRFVLWYCWMMTSAMVGVGGQPCCYRLRKQFLASAKLAVWLSQTQNSKRAGGGTFTCTPLGLLLAAVSGSSTAGGSNSFVLRATSAKCLSSKGHNLMNYWKINVTTPWCQITFYLLLFSWLLQT